MNDNQKKDNNQQLPIVIHTQYIKDMSFEIPHAPHLFRELTVAPSVDVQVEVNANHMHDNFHNVSLTYKLNGEINAKYDDGKFDAYQRTYIIESKDKSKLLVKYIYYFIKFTRI